MGDLTLNHITEVNADRCNLWHNGFPNHDDDWTGADWSNAMQGEAGEAGNVVKKLRRLELGTVGNRDRDREESVLLGKLADEIADTFLYLNLLATYYGISMEDAIIAKFDEVSIREGFPQRLNNDA